MSGGTTRSAALSTPGAPFATGWAPGAGALMGTTKSWNAEKRFGFISALRAVAALHRCTSAPAPCTLPTPSHATPHLVVSRRRATPASSATTEPDDGSEDVFVHRTSIQGADALQVSCPVKTSAQEACALATPTMNGPLTFTPTQP